MSDEFGLYGTPPPEPPAPRYPVTLDVEGPPEVGRLSTFFRIILLVPLLIPAYLVVNGFLLPFHWLTVLVRGRPVGWVFDVNVATNRFLLRLASYAFLITDRYPPFDGDWGLSYDVQRPERLQRKQLVIWKSLASIPHLIVLNILWFAVTVCLVIAWFSVLFTGRFPLGLRGFVVGWLRWVARLNAYWMSLTDEFPPFSLSADAGPATGQAHVFSGLGGLALGGGGAALVVVALLASRQTEETRVSYDDLLSGEESETLEVDNVEVTVLSVEDPYEFTDELFVPEDDMRFVSVTVDLLNDSVADRAFYADDFMLEDGSGDDHRPILGSFGGFVGPRYLVDGAAGSLTLIFEIPERGQPDALNYQPGFLKKAKFEFE